MKKSISRANAGTMRRSPTDAERRLWAFLRQRQLQAYKFRRQHPVGPYIADFVCVARRLIIEADGGQHAENEKDAARTADLERWGWRVIRFWNPDILRNTEGVLETILHALEERGDVGYIPEFLEPAHAPLPLQGEEGSG